MISTTNLADDGVIVEELFIEEYDIPLTLPDGDDGPTLDLRAPEEMPLLQRPLVKWSLASGLGVIVFSGLAIAGILYARKRSRSSFARTLSNFSGFFAAKLGI